MDRWDARTQGRCARRPRARLLGLSLDEAGLILDHEHAVKQTEKVLSRTAANGGDSVTGIHYSFYDGTNATWPVMRAWCAALEAAIEVAVAELEPLDELMRKMGDRSFRIGAPPSAPVEELVVVEPVGVGLRPLGQPDPEDRVGISPPTQPTNSQPKRPEQLETPAILGVSTLSAFPPF